MQAITLVDKYVKARYLFFKWRYSVTLANKFLLALGMAGVTGLMAQVKFALPWTPVPITGQTFAALMAGVLLGRYLGGISQVIYLLAGIIGVPWFAGWSGGMGALLSPSGGYIIGFILAALFMGHFVDQYIGARKFRSLFGLMLVANFGLIYIPGLLYLGLWFYLVKGAFPSLWSLLLMGAIPFIIGDMIKITAASTIAQAITPKQAYNGEVDKFRYQSR
jgi:biotin transport system substrate-specific component